VNGKRWNAVAGTIVVAGALSAGANAHLLSMDVFGIESGVPPYAIEALGSRESCADPPHAGPLTLRDAMDRALCNDPKIRAAWQGIKEKAAQWGQAKSAYLPTITADYQGIRDQSVTDVRDHPSLSSANRAFIQTVDVAANLVIWDFGSRSAASRAASEMMLAATASYRAALQTAFANVSKDYYAALGAAAQADASELAMEAARQTAMAAEARVMHGVAPISDKLQAETSLQEAVYAYQKAKSDSRAASGVLAIDMGQDPTLPSALPDLLAADALSKFDGTSVRDLLEEAGISDPTIASAMAQLRAAEATVDKARADGLPTISLTTKYTRNNQPASLGLGIPQFPATGRDWYFGVQVRIPIFDGFSRSYQIREAQAKVAEQLEAVRDARKQVALDVWTDYEAVTAGRENVASTQRLLELASRSFDAANRRYQGGAGSILEVLNAQSALFRARKAHVSSLTEFSTATLQLASKLGRLRDW
jgi:outer membrane protein